MIRTINLQIFLQIWVAQVFQVMRDLVVLEILHHLEDKSQMKFLNNNLICILLFINLLFTLNLILESLFLCISNQELLKVINITNQMQIFNIICLLNNYLPSLIIKYLRLKINLKKMILTISMT